MKRYMLALFALALIAGSAGHARAGATSVIHVYDDTRDAWVWVTAYEIVPVGRTIRASYCVAPEERSERRIGDIVDEVRLEATAKNCGVPVYLDQTLRTSARGKGMRSFELRGSGGHYAFSTVGSR